MTTQVLVKLNKNPIKVKVSDRATGKEVGFIQSIKLIRKDLNIFRCRAKQIEITEGSTKPVARIFKTKNDEIIFKTRRIEYEALIDFEDWKEAKDARKIFISIKGKAEFK